MASTETYPHMRYVPFVCWSTQWQLFLDKARETTKKKRAPLTLCICAVAFNDHRKVLYTIH